ncbi:hypothetical protein MMC11_006039 [Xylographa trunciseda]|nr:hypothetical protein [Xylographa trunciseda]
MEVLTPPPGGDQNRAPALLAMDWTYIVILFGMMILRLWSRLSAKNLGWDDHTMFMTFVSSPNNSTSYQDKAEEVPQALFLGAVIVSTVELVHGGARHMYYLKQEPSQLVYITELNWISQPFAIMALGLGRISVSLFLLRLLGPNSVWRRWFLILNNYFVFIQCALESIFCFTQCRPVQAIWIPSTPGANCWAPDVTTNFNIAVASYTAFHDFCLALLPVTIVWNLQMARKKKIAICVFLGLGVFAGVTAVIKIVYLNNLNQRSDLTWDSYELEAWTAAQIFLLILCGTIPALKPLYDQSHFRSSLLSVSNHTYKKLMGRLHSTDYHHEKDRKSESSSDFNRHLHHTSIRHLSEDSQASEQKREDLGANGIGVQQTFYISHDGTASLPSPPPRQTAAEDYRFQAGNMV